MRYFLAVLIFSLSLCISYDFASAQNKTQSLERLQELVNNPSEARKMRQKIKNASKKELENFSYLHEAIKKEINNMTSSLPMKIDKYTTVDTAAIHGNNIDFKYTLSNDMEGIQNHNEVMSEMKSILKNGLCTSPSGVYLIFGYTWTYSYYREDGSYYGAVIIDAKTCGFE
jgi:glucose-6-phosphate isomerase